MVNKIYIIRHGLTDISCVTKTPEQDRNLNLNNIGVQQMIKVGQYLQDCNINKIYTDDCKRTIESSQIIVEQLAQSPIVLIDNYLSNKDVHNNFKANIQELLDRVIKDKNENNICWITHGRIIKLIYHYIKNNGFPEEIPKLSWCNYGCINCIEVKDGKISEVYFGKIIED